MPKQWLLIQTKPRDELRAVEHLQAQGAKTYCPTIQVEKITRGKRIIKTEPLFPSYIFAQNPDTQEQSALTYTSIRSTRGVSQIVRFGTDYTLLPNTLIESIRCQTSGLTPSEAHSTAPKPGDKVQITEGPFQGLEAIYHQSDGQLRSMVLINILHQQTLASIDNTAITTA
jgi:transcriptional antiterminator RfaH